MTTEAAGSPIWRVLGALEESPKRSGSGYEARCPSHEDKHASLSIGTGLDGRVLLNCHAGCPPDKIVSALGLSMSDLFEKSQAGNPVRRFRLIDTKGVVVAEHLREELPGDKNLWWEAHGKRGLNGTPLNSLPLYRLPDLLAADPSTPVIVCEGEKAADALVDIGLLAVGTVTGAGGTPSDKVLDPLRDREVWLWPDNDVPGREHMANIAARLKTPPKWVKWSAAPDKGDAADYVEQGGTADDIALMVVKPQRVTPPGPRLSVVRMSDVQPEPIEWLWRGRLARGKPTLLMGDPGLGKSLITHTVAAITSTGGKWPDGGKCEKGAAILFTIEDGLADTVSPRLRAAGADMSRVIAVRGVLEEESSLSERMFALTEHLALLEQLIRDEGAVYVVMDPITAYLGPDVNSHREADVRAVLGPLSLLAERTRIALTLLMHLNKGSGVSALYRATGSIAFPAVARVVLGVAPDPNDDDGKRKLLLPIKMNIGRLPKGIGYRIETSTTGVLQRVGEDDQPPVLIFDNDPVEIDAASAMDRNGTPQELGAVAEVKNALTQILCAGRVPAAICKREIADSTGVRSETTLSRARKELGIRVRKEGFQGAWYWEITNDSKPPPIPINGNIGAIGILEGSNDFNESNPSKESFAKSLACRACGNDLPPYLAHIGLHYDCVEEVGRSNG